MPDTVLPRDGLVIVAKRDCPTCVLVEPVMQSLDRAGPLAVVSQDDPTFPSGVRSVLYDDALERSFRLNIEAVPTLIRFKDGREVERTVGWERKEWMRLAGDAAAGNGLPAWQPGCGSKSVEPGVHEALIARYGDPGLKSREIAVGNWDDPMEACFERGWTDGLPVVPPTDERILRMLGGTERKPDEVVGLIPPNLASCTVEKVAINAVMAGCKPEYMPVVLGVLEAALDPLFVLHGLLCTTHFSGPLVIINGPAAKAIGMNSGVNALGQGNRANATIGRALQLIVATSAAACPAPSIARPWAIPASTPSASPRTSPIPTGSRCPCAAASRRARAPSPCSTARACTASSTRDRARPRSWCARWPWACSASATPSSAMPATPCWCCRPSTTRSSRTAAGTAAASRTSCSPVLKRPGRDLIWGAQDVAEGLPPKYADQIVDKFQPMPDGVLIVRAGGEAGLFSAIIGGWPGQRVREECQSVTREIRP